MPPRDPRDIQADFPVLVADLIDRLQLVGTVGLLNFIPAIQPTFIVGSRGLRVTSEPPVYAQSEIVSATASNPIIAAVITNTAALPAGDYDVKCFLSALAATGGTVQELQLRNAADSATLATWRMTSIAPTNGIAQNFEFAVVVGDLQFFRVVNVTAITAGQVAATIMTHIRTVP